MSKTWYELKVEDVVTYISEEEYNLLLEFNRIINIAENGYLWRELSIFDLKLKKYFINNAEK